MATQLSRRKVSRYIASEILDGGSTDELVRQLAAFLIESGRVNESDHIIRDIELELSKSGHLIARVTSAQKLSESLNVTIREMLTQSEKVSNIELDHQILEDVIAGVRIDIPGKRLDRTVSKKLSMLRANYKR